MRRKGYTLVELLVMMAILTLMAIILIGIIDPITLINKGRDARRKKDLKRISTAFEEYYNDKGCYPNPNDARFGAGLNNVASCKSETVFSPWLFPWPCDPSGNPYEVVVGPDSGCPNEYRVYTTLEFAKDRDVPDGWGVTAFPVNSALPDTNYGVSSPNVSWYTGGYPDICNAVCDGACHSYESGSWEQKTPCSGQNCYWAKDLSCQIDSCPSGTGGTVGIVCDWNK